MSDIHCPNVPVGDKCGIHLGVGVHLPLSLDEHHRVRMLEANAEWMVPMTVALGPGRAGPALLPGRTLSDQPASDGPTLTREDAELIP
jgi:hypothetical protein